MLTSKQRAGLRAQANVLQAIFQVGKGGIEDNLIKQTDEALEARELIKLRVLDTSPVSVREAADTLAEATSSDVVQVVGRAFVLWRFSEKKQAERSRAAAAAASAAASSPAGGAPAGRGRRSVSSGAGSSSGTGAGRGKQARGGSRGGKGDGAARGGSRDGQGRRG